MLVREGRAFGDAHEGGDRHEDEDGETGQLMEGKHGLASESGSRSSSQADQGVTSEGGGTYTGIGRPGKKKVTKPTTYCNKFILNQGRGGRTWRQ